MISLCDRWHKTPAEILAMDAGALRMINIYDRAHSQDEGEVN